jgi:hypothetical protein
MRIPSSVKHIGDTAFYGCDNNAINLLCEEGSYGCYYAESHRMNLSIFMKEVGGYCIIKNGVLTSFYGEGFDDYEYHCNLVIPSNVKSIGYSAFENNNRIINIELPYSVTTIYPYAFAHCPNLEGVIIPFTVTDIADSAFEGTDATIYCYYNSYAYNYAVKNGIDYELITVTLSSNNVNMFTTLFGIYGRYITSDTDYAKRGGYNFYDNVFMEALYEKKSFIIYTYFNN